jgi:hypothetical protein
MKSHIVIHAKTSAIGPPLARPLAAALLAIDAARCSGLAYYLCGRLHYFAQCDADEPAERYRAVQDLITMALRLDVPAAIVCEAPGGGFSRKRLRAAIGLSEIVRLWRDSWRVQMGRQERFFTWTAADWRRELFGRRTLPREQARALEAACARATVALDRPVNLRGVIGPDAAAAISMGQVAIRSSALGAVLTPEVRHGRTR